MSFKLGDTVRLKSGSSSGAPWMTVIDLNWDNKPGDIRCQWYSAKGEDYKVGVFREEALRIQGSGPRAIAR